MPPPDPEDGPESQPLLPVEVEIVINPDGSVTFADLETATLPIAHELNPDQPLVCDLPESRPERDSYPAESDANV